MDTALTNRIKHTYLILGVLVLLGAFLRFSYLSELQSNPLPEAVVKSDVFDQYNFMTLAEELKNNNWVGRKFTQDTHMRYRMAILYPYFIAALFEVFGSSMNVVFIAQIIIGLCMIFIIFKTADLVFNNKTIGLIAAALTAFYGPILFYECTLLRAIPIAFSNLLSFYLFLKALEVKKGLYFLLSGLVLGLSIGLRTNVLAFFIIPYLLFAENIKKREKVSAVLLFILGIILVLFPLAVRNKMIGHNALLSSQGMVTIWRGNSYDAKGIGYMTSPVQDQLADDANGTVLGTLEVFVREAARYPKEYRNLYLRKIYMFFNGFEIPSNLNYYLFKENSNVLNFGIIDFRIVSPLAIVGLFLCFGKGRNGGLLYLYICVLSVSVLAIFITSRYRMTAVPFYILFAAYTLHWLYEKLKSKEALLFFMGCLSIAAVSFFTMPNSNFIRNNYYSKVRNIDHVNLAMAYAMKYEKEYSTLNESAKRQMLVQAVNNIERAIEIAPNYHNTDLYLKTGELYMKLNDYKKALSNFEMVLIDDKENMLAKNYIAYIQNRKMGRYVPGRTFVKEIEIPVNSNIITQENKQ